ncbi:hypothetical protein U1Q18_038634 [Sarracenia purpurea var. burkii]
MSISKHLFQCTCLTSCSILADFLSECILDGGCVWVKWLLGCTDRLSLGWVALGSLGTFRSSGVEGMPASGSCGSKLLCSYGVIGWLWFLHVLAIFPSDFLMCWFDVRFQATVSKCLLDVLFDFGRFCLRVYEGWRLRSSVWAAWAL